MYGDTITITINAIAKVLNKINQDGYSAEYYLRESTGEFTLNVRHSKEAVKAGQSAMDRHNIDLKQTIYSTATEPEYVRQIYTVVRVQRNDVIATHVLFDLGLVGFLTSTNLTKLANWES